MEVQTNSNAPLPPLPSTWPGAFGLYKYSKAAMMTNVGTYLGLLVLAFFVSGVIGRMGGTDTQSASYTFFQVVSFLGSIYISGATTLVELDNIARKKVGFSDALTLVKRYFLPLLAATVAMGILLMVSLILFIIPFFFVAPRLAFTPYLIVGEQMNPMEAIAASWEKTRGHAMKVWGIIGVNVLFVLLMITIIGLPFALYFMFMYLSATAVLFRWVQSTKPAPIEPAPQV